MQLSNTITSLWPVLLIVLLAAIAKALMQKQRRTYEQPVAKRPLTEREQSMYLRLAQALPEHIVLAQVSFSALLDAKTKAGRNRFNQKTADFVICDKAFNVIAEVELDDSSHNGKGPQDARRDDMLKAAGYKVLRFKRESARIRPEIAHKPKSNNERYRYAHSETGRSKRAESQQIKGL